MKPDLLQELDETDEILYYQGRIAQENQLKIQDLDNCRILDFIEGWQPVPAAVLEDSPIPYSYLMWIHNKRNSRAQVQNSLEIKIVVATNLGYGIIIPNRVKLGRNNYSLVEGSGINIGMPSNLKELFKRNRKL